MRKRHNLQRKAAVSLQYDARRDKAPKVTAKGEGPIAERIIALAQEHDIPIKEDPDLVQILSQVDIDEEIPPAVYTIVAELLTFVYQLNEEYRQRQFKVVGKKP